MHPAVFVDRDGVINRNRANYVLSWDQVEFLQGVFEALENLAGSHFRIVLVTNQSPVGRGLLSLHALSAINAGIVQQIQLAGGRVDGIYVCPHRPDEGCDCRKPKPGMLLQAAAELEIDLSRSYLIGDAVSDVEAALAAGCQPLLVLTGRGEGQVAELRAKNYEAVPVVADLREAVAWIMERVLNQPTPCS
jgi:D-glycero-D-manno-heptose 1,7-bisphosphate phosphatase